MVTVTVVGSGEKIRENRGFVVVTGSCHVLKQGNIEYSNTVVALTFLSTIHISFLCEFSSTFCLLVVCSVTLRYVHVNSLCAYCLHKLKHSV